VAEVKTQPAALDQIRVSKLVEISVCALHIAEISTQLNTLIAQALNKFIVLKKSWEDYLKIMEPRPIVFKEWRDTRTFSNLKSTHCTLLILLIINLVTKTSLSWRGVLDTTLCDKVCQ
jgi:hypothetical protein